VRLVKKMAQHGIAICGQIIYPFFCNDAEIFSVCFCRQPVMIFRSLFFQFRGVFTVYVAMVPRHTLSHIRVQHCSSAITHVYTERSAMTLSSGHIDARLHGRHLLIWFSHSRIGEVPQGGLGFSPPNPWSWTIFFFKAESTHDTICRDTQIISKFITYIIRQVC